MFPVCHETWSPFSLSWRSFLIYLPPQRRILKSVSKAPHCNWIVILGVYMNSVSNHHVTDGEGISKWTSAIFSHNKCLVNSSLHAFKPNSLVQIRRELKCSWEVQMYAGNHLHAHSLLSEEKCRFNLAESSEWFALKVEGFFLGLPPTNFWDSGTCFLEALLKDILKFLCPVRTLPWEW